VWAYRALGWGGYWSWDPIENAALVPWLVLCANLHRKTYAAHVCLVPFSVAAAGVFLARSGVLAGLSNHAYADGDRLAGAVAVAFVLGVGCTSCGFGPGARRKRRARPPCPTGGRSFIR
jgi:cytochrome c-type biogenesis protein CcmF